MIINDFYTREVEVYRDPELTILIEKETGEEKLKFAEPKDEEQAKITATEALLLYLRFLHQNQLNYWKSPHSKNRQQTFKLADFLVSAINSDDISKWADRFYSRL